MSNTISVGDLRRNPTSMLRAVRRGATYTVTDHGEPIASITPVQPSTWVAIEEVNALFEELGPDDQWARDLHEAHDDRPRDPWELAE